MPKLTLKEINKNLHNKNTICLQYNGSNIKSKFNCLKCNTIYDAIYSNVNKGETNNCPECHKTSKRNKNIKEILSDLGFTLLSNYKNSYTKIKYKCNECNTIFESTIDNIKAVGCPECNKSKETYRKKSTKLEYEIIPDVNFIFRDNIKQVLEYLKDSKGNYSAGKTYYPKINEYKENLYQEILNTTFYLNDDCKFNERLYHIENNLFEYPKCVNCGGNLDNFISSVKGYKYNLCSKNKCVNLNKLGTKDGHLYSSYNKLIDNYNNYFNNEIDYEYELFKFEDYKKHRNDTKIKIKHKCGYSYEITVGYQGHYKCPKCFPIRSKQQYIINEFISNYLPTKFNDRQFLKPKELDILTDTFAIEYDSINYHSFGYSDLPMLNNIIENKNIHLEKTELCEQKGIQLFRIFSNEWLNSTDKWKSILESKMGISTKIFARKCTIKEVDSKEAREFLNKNHLQNYVNTKINIGLYYEDELVSIMTFSKPRMNKNYEYELIRFCTKLNLTIIGGASKLLKYFERNYNPKSIISYANRRWSQGNVYEKLGFQFLYNTEPNYFYFKGNDSSTPKSRHQYQKHKLQHVLQKFDDKLSETQNMYNNKYRKIYDCGNKVYIKMFNI